MNRYSTRQLVQLVILSSAFALMPNNVLANTQKTIAQCDKEKNIAQQSQCLDIVVDAIDRKLQTWVNNQTFILEEFAIKNGRNSALTLFKRSQSTFIQYREDNCRWQYLAVSNTQHASLAYKKCYVMLSKNRIKELQHVQK
jgi:uncharacterized protein YecT (DUF1311 family)